LILYLSDVDVVSTFQRSVTRCKIEHVLWLDVFLLRECNVFGKVTYFSEEANYRGHTEEKKQKCYPYKHKNNLVEKINKPNTLRSMVLSLLKHLIFRPKLIQVKTRICTKIRDVPNLYRLFLLGEVYSRDLHEDPNDVAKLK